MAHPPATREGERKLLEKFLIKLRVSMAVMVLFFNEFNHKPRPNPLHRTSPHKGSRGLRFFPTSLSSPSSYPSKTMSNNLRNCPKL